MMHSYAGYLFVSNTVEKDGMGGTFYIITVHHLQTEPFIH